MASLRDVFNHAGKRVRIVGASGAAREGLALRRESIVLLEPRLEPQSGETVVFLDSGEAFRMAGVHPESIQGRVDHYRADVEPVLG